MNATHVYNIHAANSTAVISQEQARLLAPNKASLYAALKRNQYNVPDEKDPMVTVDFCLGVLERRYWCLHAS